MRLFVVASALLAACSGSSTSAPPAAPVASSVTVALNWYPEPEFGGLYEAQLSGAYERAHLAVDIQPGSAGAAVVPQTATGRVQFGVSTADEVILARAKGAEIVAIFATYQMHPACIMVHASRGITGLEQLSGGTLALEDGIPFAQWLWKKYPFTGVQRVPYGGGVAPFLLDPNYAQQAYVTSEPIIAKKQGADPVCFMVADTGYNPYANVIITSEAFRREHPEEIRAFLAATVEGWSAYLENGDRANATISTLNPSLDPDVLRGMWDVQKPLVAGGHAAEAGLGQMEAVRWQTLIGQLVEVGALTGTPPSASSVFTNEFLPAKR